MGNSDGYIFFTQTHRLYVHGVRESIRDRLVAAFGEEWWRKGVEYALQGQLLNSLLDMVEKNPNHDRCQFIETSHFGWIVVKHHNQLFADAFSDTVRAFRDFRDLNELRNEWAHRYDISPARAVQGANIMKSILAALRREEALEIERMSQEFVLDSREREDEKVPSYQGMEHRVFLASESDMAPLEAFRHLQTYLLIDKSVKLPESGEDTNAEITVTVQNTAPDNIGGPSVHYSQVVVTYLKTESRSLREVIEGRDDGSRNIRDIIDEVNYRSEGALSLGGLHPGESRTATFSLPVKKLLEVELEMLGVIDSNRLFAFHRATGLPSDVLVPIQRQFISSLEVVGVREFVNKALERLGALDSSITLSQIAIVREEIKAFSSESAEKRNSLAALTRDYALTRESTVGSRLREIILTLDEFEKKLDVLDDAIGKTDLGLIAESAQDLKQVQLAVIRLEDAFRTMVESD